MLEWVFSAENRAQITGTAPGRALSPSASPEASCACVWWGEGKETQDQNSSLLRALDDKFCLSVATVRHDLEGLTAQRESHSNPDRAVKQVIDVIQYFPKNLVLVCDLLKF